jgi:hypothetical protein
MANWQGGCVVSSPNELRSYAVDCARLAKATTHSHDKARLLNIARAWTDLADRLDKIRAVGDKVSAMDDIPPFAATSGQPEPAPDDPR